MATACFMLKNESDYILWPMSYHNLYFTIKDNLFNMPAGHDYTVMLLFIVYALYWYLIF